MKPSLRMFLLGVALAFASGATLAQTHHPVKESAAQLKTDKAALNRQLKRLQADEARLQSDAAAGRMSAESRDAYAVYNAKQAVAGEAKDIAADKDASMQMKADEAALQRQIKRLEAAEARLKADKEEGKMAAMSRDSEKVYKDQQAIKGERTDLSADQAKLKTGPSK